MGCDNTLRDSLPCAHCTRAIRDFGIRKIAYSDSDGDIQIAKVAELPSISPSSGYRSLVRDRIIPKHRLRHSYT